LTLLESVLVEHLVNDDLNKIKPSHVYEEVFNSNIEKWYRLCNRILLVIIQDQ